MIANLGSVIRDGLNRIAEEVPKVLNALKEFFAPTAEAIKAATEKIQEAWNNVRDTIAQKLDSNDSLDFVKSALERIRDILPILVENCSRYDSRTYAFNCRCSRSFCSLERNQGC